MSEELNNTDKESCHTDSAGTEASDKCCHRECGTQQRLLAAACELFGQKAYHSVTVAEICRLAEANIAAVNYHFGGKENLYAQAWHYAFSHGISKYPPDDTVPPEAPPQERLAGRVKALLKRATDPGNTEFNIMQNEMHNPTGLLKDVVHDSLDPMRREMQKIIRELLGDDCDEQTVRLCHMSIIGQALHMVIHRRFRMAHKNQDPIGEIELEDVMKHIIEFSLAGINYMRDRDNRNHTK